MKKFIIVIIIIAIAIAGFIMLSSDEQPVNDSADMEQQIPRNDTADKIINDLDEIDTTDIEAELDSEFNAIDEELLNL
ncbi:MAG: hypothetical protein Q8Q21_00380 [bacterium]|nr:hypothetical protein [bacterium]